MDLTIESRDDHYHVLSVTGARIATPFGSHEAGVAISFQQ